MARECDRLTDGKFYNGARVRIRGVKHGNTVIVSCLEINLIGANAVGANRHEFGTCFDHLASYRGLRSDSEQLIAIERIDEVLTLKCVIDSDDLVIRPSEKIVS